MANESGSACSPACASPPGVAEDGPHETALPTDSGPKAAVRPHFPGPKDSTQEAPLIALPSAIGPRPNAAPKPEAAPPENGAVHHFDANLDRVDARSDSGVGDADLLSELAALSAQDNGGSAGTNPASESGPQPLTQLADAARNALPADPRAETLRETETAHWQLPPRAADRMASESDLLLVAAAALSRSAGSARVTPAEVWSVLSREAEASPPSLPLSAGLLGDIIPIDTSALERGLQSFLQEIRTVSEWVVVGPPGTRLAPLFLASFVASAVAVEVARRRWRRPAVELAGFAEEDSAWTCPPTLKGFALGHQP